LLIATGADTLIQLLADGLINEAIDLGTPCVPTPLEGRGVSYLGTADSRISVKRLALDSRRNEACTESSLMS
jgi:hypothetical protein